MAYSLDTLSRLLTGKPLPTSAPNPTIQHLLYDSRQLLAPTETLFFALTSSRNDGHRYLPELYERGVRAFVVTQAQDPARYPDATFLHVTDTRRALQEVAKFHRTHFELPIIGITGSNGKTIVKEWLYQLLHPFLPMVRSPKSFNSQIGVPISIWQLQTHHRLAIIEAGISQVGEMQQLAPIIRCNVGLFTNLGDAHRDGFESDAQKATEKAHLFAYCDTIVYCRDHPLIHATLTQCYPSQRLFAWSATDAGALTAIRRKALKDGRTQVYGTFEGVQQSIIIPFQDEASIENAIHCWALLLALGQARPEILARFGQLSPVALRLTLANAVNRCTMINDSYSADLTALAMALQFMEQQDAHKRRTVILSDFLEQARTPTLYAQVADLLTKHRIQRLMGIGTEITALASQLPATVQQRYYSDTAAFLEVVRTSDFKEETILIKGARPFQFERIAQRLAQKQHQTTLAINLGAMVHNLNVYRDRLQPRTRLMAMVKASAYGSGSHEVARLLEYNRVDYLAVAYADEGVELRERGVTLPILVLNPEWASFSGMLAHRLEPELYSLELLTAFEEAVREAGPTTTPYPIHLKVNTGMNRLGLEVSEAVAVAQWLSAHPTLRVATVFSHLAGSDRPDLDDFTRLQAERFEAFAGALEAALPYRPLRHLLNTSGIVRFPELQYDMVRLGLGLYGIDGSGTLEAALETVSTLRATISQIKNIPTGETVGYDRMGRANVPMRSATISIGYADGLLRAAGNGRASVLIQGQQAPIIGNVCMDMCMVDVTHIPTAQVGDEVLVFGEEQPIERLAQQLGTIPYELLTSISGRVKRVYYW